VWWGLEDQVPHAVGRLAVFLYLVVAFGVVPVLVPAAVAVLEPETNRARTVVFTATGVVVAATLMYAVVRGPVAASIEHHHIAYSLDLWHGNTVAAFYVVSTCGALLSSRNLHVRWFGYANLVAVVALVGLERSAFVSLWCVWAAVTSVAVAVHLRHARRQPVPELTPT
jgi:hypothetical protein